ncbi:MAG: DUF3857 domain-containing protein [Bacteroidetes bacterium]|nr:DUF3857 domain-containing protein [Bacteroidota bacterium]
MKKTILLIAAICQINTALVAQNLLNYNWGEPVFEQTNIAENDTTGAVVLKQIDHVEWAYNDKGELDCHSVLHRKIKINNNKALENYNTIQLSNYAYNEIQTLKARFFDEKGNVIELDKSNVKKVSDENQNSYMLLAIEGAQAGGIIEYYWVKKGSRNYYGNYFTQNYVPIKYTQFSITSPINLQFITKSYNASPGMTETVDSTDKKRVQMFENKNIPALQSETRAHGNAYLQRVEYTLAYNYANGKRRIYSRATAAQNVYTNFIESNDKETKSLNSFVKKMGLKNDMTEEQKIRAIENHIKTNIQLFSEAPNNAELSYIPNIISNKYTNLAGYVRLLLATFRQQKIPYELVMTTAKSDRKFDGDFDGYNFLDDFLIYFPNINKFLDPNSMMNRLGFIDEEYLGTEGLFLKTVSMSGIESFVPSVKRIPENDYKETNHTTDVVIRIDAENLTANYTWNNGFSGYSAQFMQPFMYYANEENKKKFMDSFFFGETSTKDKLVSYEVLNEKPQNWGVKPLIINCKYSGDVLLSRAGNNILFKVGELIGKQMEMYREKEERTLPVEKDAARLYEREIIVHIPDGYTISNPEVLKMKTELVMNGNVEAFFYSDYTISGQTLTIICSEGYKRVYYPAEKYNEYVAVINAAADFNKLNLLLVKQ